MKENQYEWSLTTISYCNNSRSLTRISECHFCCTLIIHSHLLNCYPSLYHPVIFCWVLIRFFYSSVVFKLSFMDDQFQVYYIKTRQKTIMRWNSDIKTLAGIIWNSKANSKPINTSLERLYVYHVGKVTW